MIAYLTGSGFYEMPGFAKRTLATPFGEAVLAEGANANGEAVLLLPRHGEGHRLLPHQIKHRANLFALKDAGATAIISLSVCGVLQPELPLGRPFVVEDLYFPDNRLGDGSTCTLFTQPGEPGRGHLLAASLYHTRLRMALQRHLGTGGETVAPARYAHVPGPRFNTPMEIEALRAVGATHLSQTCGPEAVLANELELPYAMVGFSIDYANGVVPEPTPVATLQANLGKAKECFTRLIADFHLSAGELSFENFVYRFA